MRSNDATQFPGDTCSDSYSYKSSIYDEAQSPTAETACSPEQYSCQNSRVVLAIPDKNNPKRLILIPAGCHRSDCYPCTQVQLKKWTERAYDGLREVIGAASSPLCLFCTFTIRSDLRTVSDECISRTFANTHLKTVLNKTVAGLTGHIASKAKGDKGSQDVVIKFAHVFSPQLRNGLMHVHSILVITQSEFCSDDSVEQLSPMIKRIYENCLRKAMKKHAPTMLNSQKSYYKPGNADVQPMGDLLQRIRYMATQYPIDVVRQWPLPAKFRRFTASKGLLPDVKRSAHVPVVRLGGNLGMYRGRLDDALCDWRDNGISIEVDKEQLEVIMRLTKAKNHPIKNSNE